MEQGETVFQVNSQASSQPTPFKVGIYDAVRRTAIAQREALQNDELDSFYNLLVERERLLSKVESVNRMAQEARADGLSEADATEADDTANVVREIVGIDADSERILMQKINETQAELGEVREGRRATNGYRQAVPLAVGGHFVDRRN